MLKNEANEFRDGYTNYGRSEEASEDVTKSVWQERGMTVAHFANKQINIFKEKLTRGAIPLRTL